MDKNKLKKLANNAQIRIAEDEFDFFLKSFNNVELMLSKFKETDLGNNIKKSNNIVDKFLSISDLKEVEKRYKILKVKKESIQKNALIEDEKFVFVNKNS
ncbi:MAG: hypothetical protein AD073_000078 [Mycoplasmataceae bacterium]|nr:MAG: hypothetical protein AD073_000078 [Mycoplasmataceae bacterium]